MLPILPARAGTIPCHPRPPERNPGISCTLRGDAVASSLRPGTRKPWKWVGEKSIHSPDQLMSQPTTAVKTGMDQKWTQSMCAR
ncbi:hypothetical protein QE366_002009 [Nocardioides zeae]|nr:hypothetical protein [Nocardioides zeae]